MKILITGHSGLIGSHLAEQLLKDHEVHGISRTDNNAIPGVTNHLLDLRDDKRAERLIMGIEPEYVFHLAANAAENISVFSPKEITTTGINTFLNVLVPSIKAGKLKKFNFTSSIAVYGPITIPYREQDLPLPQDIYGVVKLSIERMLKIMGDVHDFKYCITRPHNVYGPRQNMSDPYRNVVTLFMNNLLKKEPYTIYGDGSMKRSFSYVKDVVDVVARSGMDEKTGLTLNVGSEEFFSLQKLSDLIQKVSGVKIKPKYLPTRVHEVHSAVSDHTVANALYGYTSTAFLDGLLNTWNYCKSVGPVEYIKQEVEIQSDKLPSNWK